MEKKWDTGVDCGWAYKWWCVSLSRTHRELNAPSIEATTVLTMREWESDEMVKVTWKRTCFCFNAIVLLPESVLVLLLVLYALSHTLANGKAQELTHYIHRPTATAATSITHILIRSVYTNTYTTLWHGTNSINACIKTEW